MSIDISKIKGSNKKEVVAKKSTSFFSKEVSFSSKKISDKKKTQIYKNLSILLGAGIDFKSALTIIIDQQKKGTIKDTLEIISKQVVKGKFFYEAMEMTGKFTPYEIFSVKIGEETRQLESILLELQYFFERKVRLKKQITSILTYPAFILLLTFGTLYFMLSYVVPLFETVFNQFNKELPTLTRYVITLSENFNTIFAVFFGGLVLLILGYQRLKNNQKFKKISAQVLLRIPFFGRLIREIYLTRFCQSMALLLVSKTSLIESLGLVRKMIGFYPISEALKVTEKDITKGMGLGDSLKKFKIFDKNIISMVKIAEQVNQLDSMFVNLSKQYNEEVEHKTKVMGTIIEPMLILFIGGIVGVIMISMYAPMFDLSQVIGGN